MSIDREQLNQRLKLLFEEGKQFSYDMFPKMDRSGAEDAGLVGEVLPEWVAWLQRVSNVTKLSFKDDSAPFLLINRGVEDGKALPGNGEDLFNHAKNNLFKGLELAIKATEEDTYGELLGQPASSATAFDSKQIFIVHGHNHEIKNEVEIFLTNIGLHPIVLHREADRGLTIIEKFEEHSKVGYAIILLTPDDEVASPWGKGSSSTRTERRARQNVIFEFGFFVGRLGRNRVCCLYQENVTLPSDLSGFIYKRFKDDVENVKLALAQELKAAGYQISI